MYRLKQSHRHQTRLLVLPSRPPYLLILVFHHQGFLPVRMPSVSNHQVCEFFRPAPSFSLMHLRCGQVLEALIVFLILLPSWILLDGCSSFLIHLPVERNWSYLQFLKMMNGTDKKLYIGFGVSLKVEMMSHMLSIC